MAQSKISGVQIEGVTLCPGPKVHTAEDLKPLYQNDPEHLERVQANTGVRARRIAPTGITSTDLAVPAVEELLADTSATPNDIDAILYVTQTPDHEQPCNANILHGRLGFPKHTAAWDINQGCSGWVYGLYQAYSLIAGGGMNRVLLVAGDTMTQRIHPRDLSLVPLFGDATSATLISKSTSDDEMSFSLHSDGNGHDAISVPAGAARNPYSDKAIATIQDEEGNSRRAIDLYMNGPEVFLFTLREEPSAIKSILKYANTSIEELDGIAFHQANAFILKNIRKRLKIDEALAPFDAGSQFGNLSSASIPSVLIASFGETLLEESMNILCSGFGVGLSWASCLGKIGPLKVAKVVEYKEGGSL